MAAYGATCPPAELARTVLALWEGAVLSAKIERDPKPLKTARRTLRRQRQTAIATDRRDCHAMDR